MSLSNSEKSALIKSLAKEGFNNTEAERIIKTVIASNGASFTEFITIEHIREIEQRLEDKIGRSIKKEGEKTRRWIKALCAIGTILLITQIAPYLFYWIMYMKAVSLFR